MAGGYITSSTGDLLTASNGDYLIWGDGPPPTLISGGISANENAISIDTTTFTENGILIKSYIWQIYLDETWTDTIYTNKNAGPAVWGDSGTYRLKLIPSNNGGEGEPVYSLGIIYVLWTPIYPEINSNAEYIQPNIELEADESGLIHTAKDEQHALIQAISSNTFIRRPYSDKKERDFTYLADRFKRQKRRIR